ncbi:MAG: hypothetical protein K2W95_34130 [Candidatus Obscuribacterales bacterium]|nr:hypothetical protein [Candidatus Obscuribacterales bacterium]
MDRPQVRWALYVLSALTIGCVFWLVPGAQQFLGAHFCVTFWLTAGADFVITQSDNAPSEQGRFGYSDRFLAYLFVAWLICPVRLGVLYCQYRARRAG